MNTILIHFLGSFHFSVCLRLLLAVVIGGHIGLNIIVSNDRRTVQLRKEVESLDGVVFSVIE